MTPASEALAAEKRHPRAVVYLYSQTGQLREVADALTAPLVASGWDIRRVDVQPRVAFPFPWPIRRFFGVFPAAVDPEALVELVEPAGGFDTDPEELVILAYQVWYLAPSLPIRSLLKTHPEAVRNRTVVTLIACRNMWYSAAIEMSGLLRSAGARRVEVVAATDTRRQSTTLVTTLRWLLTGRREPFLWFGRAGIGEAELARVADVGRSIAESERCPKLAAPIVPTLAAADLLAATVFRRWGAAVRSAWRFGAVAQAATLATFVLGLGIGIVVGMPLIGCAALAGGARFDTVVGGFVRRRITSPGRRPTRRRSRDGAAGDPSLSGSRRRCGPAGLATAHWLRAWGIDVVVVERRLTPRKHPQATMVNTRTTEILRLLGLSDPVLAESTTLESSSRVTFLADLAGQSSGASKSFRAQRNSWTSRGRARPRR